MKRITLYHYRVHVPSGRGRVALEAHVIGRIRSEYDDHRYEMILRDPVTAD